MKNKEKSVLGLIMLISIMVIITTVIGQTGPNKKFAAVRTFDFNDMLKPENLKHIEYKGYFLIETEKELPKEIILKRGEELKINLIIKFIPLSDKVTAAPIIIDSNSGYGLEVEQVLLGGKSVRLNDYLRYDPQITTQLNANQEYKITATVKFPETLPTFSIPLRIVGIYSNYTIVDNLEALLVVQ